MPSSKASSVSNISTRSKAASAKNKSTTHSTIKPSLLVVPPAPVALLNDLEADLHCTIQPAEFEGWIKNTGKEFLHLEEYGAFWSQSKAGVAGELCGRLDKYLVAFISKDASWSKENVAETAIKITAVLELYKPIIQIFEEPPASIYRRLEGFHRNIFRIYQYGSEAKVGILLNTIVDVLELWFLNGRPDGYKLMANCVVYVLCKPKYTGSVFQRLLSWRGYFDCFRRPWTKRAATPVAKKHFSDLEPNEWEESDQSSEAVSEPVATEALLAVEKVEYLCDALYKLFNRQEATSLPDGRKFLTMLVTLHQDFMNIARLGIDDVMMNDRNQKTLEILMDIVLKAWSILNKEDNPLKLDLEALVITDLMKRAIVTDPKYKNGYLSKYQLMVAYMYNDNDAAIRRMFHSNLDLMVLEGCKSENRITRTNALRLLGLCFPLISPDELRVSRDIMLRDQVDIAIADMKSIFPAFRSAASEATGEILNRGWNAVPLAERTTLLRCLSDNFFDATTVAVRANAVKAVGRIIDNPLARVTLVPLLMQMKEVATDEALAVRTEYYRILWQAVQSDMLALENGNQIVDAEKLLVHYTEKKHPYEADIAKILDYMVWNTNNMRQFLKNAIKLFHNNAAVAVKFFHNVPKKKDPKDIRAVLDAIFSQLFIAFNCRSKKLPDPEGAIFLSDNKEHLNIGLELGGTIMAASVLILNQNTEYNEEIQLKATSMLKVAIPFTDVVETTHLYRIACRVPKEQLQYCDWCLAEFESIGEQGQEDDAKWIEHGITLMTFLHTWGLSEEFLGIINNWILTEQQRALPTKKGRANKHAENGGNNVQRAHLGILFLGMLLSDTDISGTFEELEAQVNEVVDTAAKAFKDFLPQRLFTNRIAHHPFRDSFYNNVIQLMSLVWLQGVRYKKDQTFLRKHFLEVLMVVKEHVCKRLELPNSANLVPTIEAYKNEGKNILAHKPLFPGHHETVQIADRIMFTLQEVLKQFGDLISTEDPEMHILLHGYAPGGAPHQVTLVTPSTAGGNLTPTSAAPPRRTVRPVSSESSTRSLRPKRGKK
ncbi:uncharacterized protein LOC129597579 [Paramacrobiotus metropolitanus]|uniref:uncharacterized protein LOC129597579 n=1 Tax=Paramacrobiotus metropolitanus TaxID=2943436 RepID=UPI0024459BB8|nr:uncharacterized protein LOC129597579 [Paramacrobiotus metropolitanus]XP_055351168.1 uncharacterized protein LOC129597579 [Paramacrobiotus metropolitanus]